MKTVIFAEGNGYGHAARDKIISRHFDIPIITFGKGAEYCRKNDLDLIEIPTPYIIGNVKDKVKIITNVSGLLEYLKPEVTATIQNHFREADSVIVDGSYFGLAIAMLMRKKTFFITNDTASLVGIQGAIAKTAASSFRDQLLKYPKALIIPDFPPPLTVTLLNLNSSLPMVFTGPMTSPGRQREHKKKYLVSGHLAEKLRPMLGNRAIYGDEVDDFSAYYRDAELVFAHGGHSTIMEALGFGKPLVCVTSRKHPEQYNNALALKNNDVGIMLDENHVSAESIAQCEAYAKTLNKSRLSLYRKTAKEMNPAEIMERIL